MDRETYLQRWSALHGGAPARGIVRGWLSGVHALARPLARVGVAPWVLTLAGTALVGFAAVIAVPGGLGGLGGTGRPGGAAAVAAGVLLAVGGIFDNLDGAVAVLRSRTSARGALLDAVCDRIGDAGCALVLWACGAPAWLALLAGGMAQLQEYLRARVQGLGVSDIGVVSVAERPVRIAIASSTTAASAIVGWLDWATLGAGVWAALAVIGFGQVAVALGRRL